MKILYKNPDLYIAQSNISGWGVFCKSDISEGDIIEECNCIDVTGSTDYFNLDKYVFTDDKYKLIPVGFCLSLNSKEFDNVFYKIEDKIITFISKKNIKSGEELVLFYSNLK